MDFNKIEKRAISHMKAKDLADILQQIPGDAQILIGVPVQGPSYEDDDTGIYNKELPIVEFTDSTQNLRKNSRLHYRSFWIKFDESGLSNGDRVVNDLQLTFSWLNEDFPLHTVSKALTPYN